MDYLDEIMAYESGELSGEGVLKLFAGLIRDGSAWRLQGHYGLTASALISDGWILPDGTLSDKANEAIVEGLLS